MGYRVEDRTVVCECFFCKSKKKHPSNDYHNEYRRMSDVLLVAESLKPEDRIPIEFCVTCTHIRTVEV